MPTLRAAALSDIGRIRRRNEDRFVCDENVLLFGVADGVGGLPGGAEAADLTIQEISEGVRRAGTEADLTQLVQHANNVVASLGATLSPALGIGSTLTFALIAERAMRLAHVGDSRCYVAFGREFRCLTEDHSVENEARVRRARGEVIHYHHANRNALTRCIGQPGRVDPDVLTRPLVAGERYLFCTDGVTRMIPEHDLAELVLRFDAPEAGIKEIIAEAVRRGGLDNATGVLIHVDAA